MKRIVFQKEPIDSAALLSSFGTASDGALVSFEGRARNNSGGKTVEYLEYEIFDEMARKELQSIVDAAADRWPISDCMVIHRYGQVDIGEASILIAASSPHRKEAFLAVQYIIDTVKEKVPIWKKEYYSDGSSWIDGKAKQ